MPYVDYAYYSGTYLSDGVSETDFPQYEARAEMIIEAVTRFYAMHNGLNGLPENIQTLYKNAICAEIDYLSFVGIDTAIAGTSASSFTVGKVSVTEGGDTSNAAAGMIAPAAKMLLEQTGLMSRVVGVPVDPFVPFPLGVW